MFNVGTEDDISYHEVRLTRIDITATHLEFPGAFNPLTDTLEGSYIL